MSIRHRFPKDKYLASTNRKGNPLREERLILELRIILKLHLKKINRKYKKIYQLLKKGHI